MKIQRPTRAEIRSAWPREDSDLTPWLAGNLDLLEDVGLEQLDLVGTEIVIPGFRRRLDILAVTGDGRRVAIENQFRSVDHDHLTRGLAYAVGLEASALVVVAEEHGDEFIAVADYLNHAAEALGDDGLAIFLVALQVDKVGEFLVPRLHTRARPNAWLTQVRKETEAGITGASDERQQARRQYWADILPLLQADDLATWGNIGPRASSDIATPAISGLNVQWSMVVHADKTFPRLWIDVGDSETNLNILYELRDSVGQNAAGLDLFWESKEGARSCTVSSTAINDCGWTTPANQRTKSFPAAVELFRTFKSALEPHLAAIATDL